MPTCCSAPRSRSSIIGSPAICLENRVQRAQRTQRSRSSSTCWEIGSGLGYVRFSPSNRVSDWPLLIAWFCSGHSPPLSQIGQSSGWFISRNSICPRCAFSATGEDSWVRTTMFGATSIVHEACGLGIPRPLPASGISTRHWRHAPTGSSNGWSQNRGIWMPISSAARMSRVPFGTLTSMSSIVSVTRSSRAASSEGLWLVVVMRMPLRWRTAARPRGRTGSGRARGGRGTPAGRTSPTR